jgi:hypothetical protein
MKRPLHIFTLLLFALTQFVAPFAHAHVNGTQDTTSIHTSSIPHGLSVPALSQCHAESHESPAISIQQEYQRNIVAIIPAISVSAVPPFAPNGTTRLSRQYDSLHSIAFAYYRPHPQAPPA